MSAARFDRNVEQISNKLKLKDGVQGPKKGPRSKRQCDRPACQVTGALNSATIMLESMVDDSLQQSCTDPEFPAISDGEDKVELPPPLGCSSPAPSCSSSADASSEWHKTWCVNGKRKRDSTSELVQYLERADERFLQHSKEMDDALRQDMRADTHSLLGLMGRIVAVMEAQSQK
ncbi:unnamed protein product [Leuciscus chuanchicus]